jgi:hypothetical protein
MGMKAKTIIGRTATAAFPAEGTFDVPVKIDTGADSSAIWASELDIDDDNILHFVLFDSTSPYYSGKVHSTKHFSAHLIRSSNGLAQVRYRVELSIVLAGRKIRGSFTLADRSQNAYPVLVGCKLLNNKFLVDVSLKSNITPPNEPHPTGLFDEELRKNPKAFFEKYHKDNQRGDIAL